MYPLNISKLIEQAEKLTGDDRFIMAAESYFVVQKEEIEGKIYELRVMIKNCGKAIKPMN